MKQLAILFLTSLFWLVTHATAESLQTAVVSSTEPSFTSCTEPPAATSFPTTAADIYEYIVIQNMNAGDRVTVDWVAPNGSVRTTVWNNALANAGNYCWVGGLLPQSVFSTLPGNWQLQVFVNGHDIGQTSFTIISSASQSTTTSTPVAPKCGAFSDPTNPYPCCANGGNCTWWAWYQAQVNWGVTIPNWGNANQWWAKATASGYSESTIPAVNTIAVNTTFNGTGHVAWVTQVNSDGSVVVSEMNCDSPPPSPQYPSQQYNKVYPANWFTSGGGGFIYPRGTEGTPVITSLYPATPIHSPANLIITFYGANLNASSGKSVGAFGSNRRPNMLRSPRYQ